MPRKDWAKRFPRCCFCGEDNTLNLEVWGHDWQFQPCCEELGQEVADELEEIAAWEGEEGRQAFYAQLFQVVQGGALEVRGLAHLKVNYQLSFRVLQGGPDWQLAKVYIAEHHQHHKPPQGWKFGVGCWNGPSLVDVAIVGRPVSRMLQKAHPDWLEVTRLCTTTQGCDGLDEWQALRRQAASGLYEAAVLEAGLRGSRRVVTYTLETESAKSVQMARFKKDKLVVSKGGSWNRPGRARQDKAPTCAKVRWGRECVVAAVA